MMKAKVLVDLFRKSFNEEYTCSENVTLRKIAIRVFLSLSRVSLEIVKINFKRMLIHLISYSI